MRGVADRRSGGNRRLGPVAGLIGVLALLGIVGLVSLSNSGSRDEEPLAENPPATAAEAPEQGCIDKWNASSSDRNFGRQWLGGDKLYAAVGFSADFPDRCLVTLASPDMGGQATQIQEANGMWVWEGNSSPESVPESAKQWNATREPDGTLTPGPP